MRIDAPFVSSSDWRRSWLTAFPCDLPSTVPYPQAPLSCLLRHTARRLPEHPACTLYGQATSYAALDDQAHRLATALRDLGARPGRHIGLLLPNIPEYLVALQAVWLTGATALQLSPLMVAEEIDHWIEATECHLVVTLDLLAPMVMGSFQRGPLEHVVLTSLARRMAVWRGLLYCIERLRRNGYLRMPDDAHRHPFERLLQADPLTTPVDVDPAEAVAVVAPTGGTTAASKAVMLTHRNLIANAMQLRDWYGGADGEQAVLAVLPFFHAYGLTVSLVSAWAGSCTMHLHPPSRRGRRWRSCTHPPPAADAGRPGHPGDQPGGRVERLTCRCSPSSPARRRCTRPSARLRQPASAPSSRVTG
ncbi:MAG: AMP-binding protein [Gemmataceae bacterium]